MRLKRKISEPEMEKKNLPKKPEIEKKNLPKPYNISMLQLYKGTIY